MPNSYTKSVDATAEESRAPAWPLILAVVAGLLLSIAAWLAVAHQEDREARLEFNSYANSHALILQSGIAGYIADIEAVRALFESSQHPVSRDQFALFTNMILRGQTAILSVSWIPHVRRGERAQHEKAAADDGLAGYRIRTVSADGKVSVAPEQADYLPVYYRVEQEHFNEKYVYGVDQGDRGIRQKAFEQARDTGRLTLSEDLTIRSGEGKHRGFLAVLPVYRKGLPHDSVGQRRDNLVGFIRGVFETPVMIETILRTSTTPHGVDLYFFHDPDPALPPVYVHSSRQRQAAVMPLPRSALEAGLHWTGTIAVGDRPFTVVAAPIPGGPGTAGRTGAWAVLVSGLLLTAALIAYFWMSGRHARRVQSANVRLDHALLALGASSEQLRVQNLRFDTALNNMLQGLLMFDAGERIVVCNDRYIDMHGLSRDIVKPGCPLIALLRHLADIGQLNVDPDLYRLQILAEVELTTHVKTAEMSDGREILVSSVPMAQGGWVTTFEDVTERRRAAAQIAHMALHDALTNLPNRLFFRQKLENCLALLGHEEGFAVLCLDLDHFKSVNDTLGHPFGDKLLRQAADRLRSCLRDSDSLARLGGDEFAILQSDVVQPTESISLMTRLIEVIGRPFDLDGHQVVIGVSIGIALAPADATDPDRLLKSADMALYRAKKEGRGAYRFFEPEMDARMQARRALELAMRRALVNHEFELYYQPIVSLETETITGFEALIRWHHPERGMVAPADFIPLAEETALIVPIGEWVLQQACTEAVNWPDNLSIAVNLSPAQFKTPDLPQTILQALTRSGLAPHRLELEITEAVLLVNNESTLATLHQLRALGIRISMDDFGTGYSSLSYLRSFPFDKIKIDQSFIHNLSDSEDSQAIIRAVAGLGNSLRMVTTGEGVETQEELDYLRQEGCIEAQGFFFSKPRPARDIAGILADQRFTAKAVQS